jgi:flagella basal body P-ring formation protein FlgA
LATILAAVAAASASSAGADEVRLRASVRVPAGEPVLRLEHVAELVGPEAQALRGVELLDLEAPGFDRVRELSFEDIRAALDGAGAHWGRVNLSGRSVALRPRAPEGSRPPMAMQPAVIDAAAAASNEAPAPREEPEMEYVVAGDIAGEATLRSAVADLLARQLKEPADRVRLGFRASDGDVLGTHLSAGRFEIDPLGSPAAERVEIAVRFWRGGRVQRAEKITVIPAVLRDVPRLARGVHRGESISQPDLDVTREWLAPPVAAMLASPASIQGGVASRTLHEGDVVRSRDVAGPTLIHRGDRVFVRCLSGGVVITLEAEARSDAAEGEPVELRRLGERSTFSAIAAARGEAVLDLGR